MKKELHIYIRGVEGNRAKIVQHPHQDWFRQNPKLRIWMWAVGRVSKGHSNQTNRPAPQWKSSEYTGHAPPQMETTRCGRMSSFAGDTGKMLF